jgi:hypothetical protein
MMIVKFFRVFDQLDVGNRVTVDQQQVGERAFPDDAQAPAGVQLPTRV